MENVELFLEHGLDIKNRIITIGKEPDDSDEYAVGGTMVMQVYKNTFILEQKKGTITYIMHTPGGDDNAMWGIYDTIKSCKNHTVIKVVGGAHSAGILILQAAKERVMSPNSRAMMHYDIGGSMIMKEKKTLDRMYEDILFDTIIKKNPTFKRSTIRRWLNTDTYFSAEQCLELGLIDRIE